MTTEPYLRHGSWKCGKGRAFTTFPQAFFFFLDEKIPKKITMKKREGGASASHPPVELLLKHLAYKFLTLQNNKLGGKLCIHQKRHSEN